MLTRLKVNGFKNLVDVDVRFGPFTCIAGANGAGKSNLFDAIRFLSAIAGAPLLDAALTVRNESGRNADVRSLFQRIGDQSVDKMSFSAEMIVPAQEIDELGQSGKASITFLRYELEIGLRQNGPAGSSSNPLEILRESLVHIKLGDARRHILFPHNAKEWRERVVTGRRSGVAFISTEERAEGKRIIKLHQDAQDDKGGGRAFERAAAQLPRTVLSSATAAESPTALCAKREMESWLLLQLEPAALREPDEVFAPVHLSGNGRHLPAVLYRLANAGEPEQVYCQLSNRLSELIGSVRGLRVVRDDKRELLTLHMTGADGTELPARALSDGTLRFLALSVLELDPDIKGIVCLEEPENGIHPERIPAIVRLLEDIAVDPKEPADETNPLRQVIINTHSPSVVMAVRNDSLLLAKPEPAEHDGKLFTKVTFACVAPSKSGTKNWRSSGEAPCPEVTKGELLAYLNPAATLRTESMEPARRHRVIDEHPDLFDSHVP